MAWRAEGCWKVWTATVAASVAVLLLGSEVAGK